MPVMSLDEAKSIAADLRDRMKQVGRHVSKETERDILCRTIWARSKAEWVDLACDAIDEASASRLPWKGGRDVRELTRRHAF